MKKQEIKKQLTDLVLHLEKCKVESNEYYYNGWKDCSNFIIKELNFIKEKI